MSKKDLLLTRLQDGLENLYHNATIHSGKLRAESEYECDLFESTLGFKIEHALSELEDHNLMKLTRSKKLYQYGRSGATLTPENLIELRGGSRFKIKDASDFAMMSVSELTELVLALEDFNKQVRSWCSRISDYILETNREEYSHELELNKNKKKVIRKVVSYE